MDLSILKKKISTFRSDGGKIRNVSDEVLEKIIHSWENWPGSSSKFYSSIGLEIVWNKKQDHSIFSC